MKVIIVDDEEQVRESLTQLLDIYCSDVDIVGSYSTLHEGLISIKQKKPDVVLLDIEIGKENGFDIFKHFAHPDFKVVFITAYQNYAVQAFRFSAMDYLLKPVDPDLLVAALNKAVDKIEQEKLSLKIEGFLGNLSGNKKANKKVVLKTTDNIHVVNLGDILYCEADRSYTSFFLNDKSRIVVSTTLGEYEELFEAYDFIRVHQSFLVNLDYVKRFEKSDGGKLILKNEAHVPVSNRKKETLLQRLAQL